MGLGNVFHLFTLLFAHCSAMRIEKAAAQKCKAAPVLLLAAPFKTYVTHQTYIYSRDLR